MRKISKGNGHVEPHKPWSQQRRSAARFNALQRLHGTASEPDKTFKYAHSLGRSADRVAQEADMNQHVRANWTDAQKRTASNRAKVQWEKRKSAGREIARADMKKQLKELKALKRSIKKTASIGKLLRLDGAIEELKKRLEVR